MRVIMGSFLLILLTLCLSAQEDFDTFDDEEMSFVIKTSKPKIKVKEDSTLETSAVQFEKLSSGENKAITMSVKNFLIFSKLKTIDDRYMVMELSLKNLLPKQKVIVSEGSNHPSSWVNKNSEDYTYKEAIPTYRIPDIKKHIYMSINNGVEVPLDIISVMLDKPLLKVNENKIDVFSKIEKEGQLAFRLPTNTKIEQLSLHYYDTRYGNIDIPIIGEMKKKTQDITTLPTSTWAKMSDNLSVAVSGYEVTDHIGKNKANNDGQFEIVEIDIESKVFALLQFNPSKRFYLNIGGDKTLKLHPVTQALPMGMYNDISLSPGANNKFRLVFYVPKGLEKQSRSLKMEIHGKDISLPIKKETKSSVSSSLAKSSIPGTSLNINGVYSYKDKIAVDMTFDDKEDAYSSRLHSPFYLNNKPEVPDTNSKNVNYSSELILSMKDTEVILNGSKKRVWLWFDNPFKNGKNEPVYLVSNLFTSLKLKIDKKPENLPNTMDYVFAKYYPYEYKMNETDKKVLALVESYKAKHNKAFKNKTNIDKQHIVKLENKNDFTVIPPLSSSYYGESKLEKLKTVNDLILELKKITWVPSAYEPTASIYSTASIFTQGWGSENEMFKAVYNRVKDFEVKFGSYLLSDAGGKALLDKAGSIPMQEKMPFIEWIKEGKTHTLVFPFLEPLEKVTKYIESKSYLNDIVNKQVSMEMTLTYEPVNDGTSVGSFGSFGGALGGTTTTEKTDVIFKKSWNLDEVSDAPVDVLFPGTTAFYTDYTGTHQDNENALSAKKVLPKLLVIQITMPDGKLDVYRHYFNDKEELKDIFFTFALGTPNISRDVLKKMEEKRKSLFGNKNKRDIGTKSFLQWLNRAKIYKFVTMQSANDKRLSDTLNIQAYRNKSPLAIMAVLENRPKKKPVSSLDIRRVFNDVYGDENATRSFNVMSGVFNAQAEAKVIRGGQGIFDFWKEKDINLTMIVPNQKSSIINIMKRKGVDERIIDRLSNSSKIWLYPLNKKKNIGWLEIDPDNYHTVSVYENGMYAAMTEESEIDALINNATQYFLGFYSGTFFSVFSLMDAGMIIPDFCTAVSVAENTANNVACGVGVATSQFSGLGILGAGLGCAGLSNEALGVSVTASIAGNKTLEGKLVGGFLGFGNGFGNAVAMYFAMVKKGSGCK